jgi:hypothetical protein
MRLLFNYLTTFIILLIYILNNNNINGKISKSILDDITIALGKRDVKSHYPELNSLSIAIDHIWEIWNSTILMNQNFVGCSTYSIKDITSLKEFTDRNDISIFNTYSSAREDRYCFISHLNITGYNIIMNPNRYNILFLHPIPITIKFDHSIIKTLQWLHSSQLNVDVKNINQQSEINHPIISDSIAGKKIEISVMYKDNWNTNKLTNQYDSLKYWIKNYSNFFQSINNDNIENIEISKSKRHDNIKSLYDNYFPVNNFKSLKLDNNNNNHPHILWTYLKDTLDKYEENGKFPSSNSIKNKCWHEKLNYKHRKNNILISLPKEVINGKSKKREIFTMISSKDSTYEQYYKSFRNNNIEDIEDIKDSSNDIIEKSGSFCLSLLLLVIGSDPSVTRLSLSRPMHLLNNHAISITQSGSKSSKPYHDAGLKGKGIVVGLSDTGLDQRSCFFKDTHNHDCPSSTVENPQFDNKYRKVIQYIKYSDSTGDYTRGHGSHVSSTIIGSTKDHSKKDYNGIASDAKIAFFDIGIDNVNEDLTLPYDIKSSLYPPSYMAGARIHSNSWGGGYCYDSYSIETDSYLYDNQDFLIVYAAGNDGGQGYYTVLSPGNSKNAIAVACSGNAHSKTQYIDQVSSFSALGPAHDGKIKPDITAPGDQIESASAYSEDHAKDTCATTLKSGI